MDRLASKLTIIALFSLPFVACGDDSSTGSGTEGATGSGTAGSSSGDTTSMTMPTTTNMGGTSNTTGSMETGVDSTGGTTSNGDTTSGGEECDACVGKNCGNELADCLDEPDCACWLECLDDGNNPPDCADMCNGMPPGELPDLNDCIDAECDVECNGGGPTTGNMGDGETYDECMGDADCPMTDCSNFLGYCSVDCMGDDASCPMPATGNIMPVCGGQNDDRCLLPCGGGGDVCPDGMSCEMVGGNNELCVFP